MKMIDSEIEAMEVAYDEARTILDFQLDIAERLEREIQKTIRINLLILGSFFPILKFSSEGFSNGQIFGAFLPWVSISALFIFLAILFSVILHRSRLYYGGYEDSAYLNFESITGRHIEDTRDTISESENVDFINEKEFYIKLLFDFSKGIKHNNKETDHMKLVLTRVEHMMILGIFYLFVGIFIIYLGGVPSIWSSAIHSALFLMSCLPGLFIVVLTVTTVHEFRSRNGDPDRLSAEDFDFPVPRSNRGFPNE